MFDRLDDILIHYEELMQELNSPSVTEDQNRFRRLMKEQADLAPLVETYREYKKTRQDEEESLGASGRGARRGTAGAGQGGTV